METPTTTATHNSASASPAGFMSIGKFCSEFDVCRAYAYRLLGRGSLQAVKSGRKTLIRRESAEQWAASLPAFESKARAA